MIIRSFESKKLLFGDKLTSQITPESAFMRRKFITKSMASLGLIGVPFSSNVFGSAETTILTTMANWITPEQSNLSNSKKSQVTRTSALTIIFMNLVLVKGTPAN